MYECGSKSGKKLAWLIFKRNKNIRFTWQSCYKSFAQLKHVYMYGNILCTKPFFFLKKKKSHKKDFYAAYLTRETVYLLNEHMWIILN